MSEKKFFYGHEISEYGIENGYVDYRTLAKALGGCILNNTIMEKLPDLNIFPEMIHGSDCYYDDDDVYQENPIYKEIFQYYVISEYGAKILEKDTEEIVFYIEELDMYIWGVTHIGTAWDYVLTDIKIGEY